MKFDTHFNAFTPPLSLTSYHYVFFLLGQKKFAAGIQKC